MMTRQLEHKKLALNRMHQRLILTTEDQYSKTNKIVTVDVTWVEHLVTQWKRF